MDKTDQKPVLIQILKKDMELAWTHVTKNDNSIAKQALQWKPQGQDDHGILGEEIWSQKWGQHDSSTAEGRWRQRPKTELDAEKWSVACVALGATKNKSSEDK